MSETGNSPPQKAKRIRKKTGDGSKARDKFSNDQTK
jgi:hypothetical protein